MKIELLQEERTNTCRSLHFKIGDMEVCVYLIRHIKRDITSIAIRPFGTDGNFITFKLIEDEFPETIAETKKILRRIFEQDI